jgi:hypothetical protein
MSARAVPCEVPAIKRNIVSGWKAAAGSPARANREGVTQKSRCGKRGPCDERLRSHLLEVRFWITSELPTSTNWLDFADAKGVLLSLEAVNPLFIPHRSQ